MIIETDAVEVVQAMYSEAFVLSDMANLVEELRSLLTFYFVSWRVQQRPRSCNRVAHELAILGSVCDPDEDNVPASIPANILCIIAEHSASPD